MKLFQPVTPTPYEREIARIGQLSTELQKQIYRLESLLLCISQERGAGDNPGLCHDHEPAPWPSPEAIRANTDKTTYARYEDLLFLSNVAHQRANEIVTGQWMASAACPGSLILFLPVQELFSESASPRSDGDDGRHHKQARTFSAMHVDKEFAAFEYSARDFEDIQLMLEFVAREITRLASDIKGARKFVRDLLYWQHSTS